MKQLKNAWSNTIGINVSIPILDKRATKSSIQRAQLAKQTNELELQDQQKTLYKTIEGFWLDANSAQQQYLAAKEKMKSSQISFDLIDQHFVSTIGTDYLTHTGSESRNHISLTIFYLRNKKRSHPYAFIGKSGICAHHFTHRYITRTEAQRNGRLNILIFYPEAMNKPDKSIRIKFTHQISRYPVVRVGKPPFQGNDFPIIPSASISRAPCLAILVNKCLFYIPSDPSILASLLFFAPISSLTVVCELIKASFPLALSKR